MSKKVWLMLLLSILAISTNAQADDDDALKPAKKGDAIAQYEKYWDMKDPTLYLEKEVTWKLYVQLIITPLQGYGKTPEWLLGGLTTDPEHYVYIPINHLYNSMNVIPKYHQWIVVRGRITKKGTYTIWTGGKRKDVNAFFLDPEEAVLAPKDKADGK